MLKNRLDALADGIFSIVLTLLVIEIKIPAPEDFHGKVDTASLWHSLVEKQDLFLSYLLSFIVLFTYWRAHAIIISTFTKNTDNTLLNINALFFLFVALVPFSSHFMGAYAGQQLPVVVYATNVFIIGMALFAMGKYIIHSPAIENTRKFGDQIKRNMAIRSLLNPVSAVVAIAVSFFSPNLAVLLFILGTLLSFLPRWIDFIDWATGVKFDEDGNRIAKA